MNNTLKKPFDLRFSILGLYFIVTFCSIFNVINLGLQLLLFIFLVILYADKIKLRSILVIAILVVIHFIRFLYAGNFGLGFWDPINFLMKYISLFQLFIVYDIFTSLEENKKNRILKLVLMSISITNVISMYYNLGDMYAIRYRPEQYPFIINFNQFYVLPMLVSALITKILYERTAELLVIFTLLSSIVVLLIGNLMTGLMLGVFSSALVLILWFSKSYRSGQLITVSISLLTVIFLRNPIANLIRRISTFNIFSELASSKLLVAAEVLEGGEATSTLSVRDSYKQSAMNSFKDYTLFGLPYEEYRYGTVASHADWYDFLAMNGLVGFIALLFVLIDLCVRVFKNIMNETNLISYTVALVIFITLGFLNPSFSVEILLMTFIVSSNISFVK